MKMNTKTKKTSEARYVQPGIALDVSASTLTQGKGGSLCEATSCRWFGFPSSKK